MIKHKPTFGSFTYITPTMLRAYSELMHGPLLRHGRIFVGVNGGRHHLNAVNGLVRRKLACIRFNEWWRQQATLTRMGKALEPRARGMV